MRLKVVFIFFFVGILVSNSSTDKAYSLAVEPLNLSSPFYQMAV